MSHYLKNQIGKKKQKDRQDRQIAEQQKRRNMIARDYHNQQHCFKSRGQREESKNRGEREKRK